ncbi:MAG: glycerophosphodiester phosphodiesterase [Planctomycetes bacterium]|nr:glycerophosphodiester phosphodiesterase [Planctomycetota bacterium]
MPTPTLVAHRGLAARCPENTLPSLEQALQEGAEWIELDVQLSADLVPLLFHDRTLERMCGAPGAIHEHSSEELARLSCCERGRFGERFAGTRIARVAELAQLLERHPGARAFVEIKRVALERFGSERVLARTLEPLRAVAQRCVLISFSLDFLEYARAHCALPLGAVFDRWEERLAPQVARIAPEFIFCDLEGLPAQGRLEHAGARIAIYEVDDARIARALAERGVEFVESFEVAGLAAALREGGPAR